MNKNFTEHELKIINIALAQLEVTYQNEALGQLEKFKDMPETAKHHLNRINEVSNLINKLFC